GDGQRRASARDSPGADDARAGRPAEAAAREQTLRGDADMNRERPAGTQQDQAGQAGAEAAAAARGPPAAGEAGRAEAPATVPGPRGAPGASAPDAGQPGTGSPDTGSPDTGSPGTGSPGTGQPGTGTPDRPR